MKKIISIIISLTLLITAAAPCFTAFANVKTYGYYYYSEYRNNRKCVIIDAYKGKSETVKIPSKIKGKTVVSIGYGAFEGNKRIKKVVIPDSVKTISGYAFNNCKNLSEVKIGKGIKNIYEDAFNGCKIYKNRKNGILYIGNCLIDVKPKSTEGKITVKKGTRLIAANAFQDCVNITELVIPDSVKYINDGAFSRCKNLISVKLPAELKAIRDYLFNGCTALEEITLPDTLKTIGKYAFMKSGLKAIEFPESVTKIGDYAFCNTASLKEISLPQGFKKVPFGFVNDSAVEKVTLPDGVKTIRATAFSGCKNLKSISLPEGLRTISYSAFYDSGLEEVTLPDSVVTLESDAFSQCENLKTVNLNRNLKTISYYAFYKCPLLEEIDIPDSVENLEAEAFSGCEKLKSVKLGNGLKHLGSNVFNETAVYYLSDYEDGVKYIDYAVITVDGNPEEINFKEGTRIIADGALEKCKALKKATLPKSFDGEMFEQFNRCEALEEIKVNEENEYFKDEDGIVYSKDGTKLYKVPAGKEIGAFSVPDGVTEIADNTFAFSKIESLTLADSVKYIGINAFNRCTKLTEVDLGKVERINYCAFVNCENLKTVTLPDTVKALGSYAFGIYFPTELATGDYYTEDLPCSVKRFVLRGSVNGPMADYLRAGDSGDDFSYGMRSEFTDFYAPKVKVKGGKKKITVKWRKSKGAQGFAVKYKKKGGEWKIKYFKSEKSVTRAIKELKKGTYRVKVYSYIDLGWEEPEYRLSEGTKTFTVKVK